MGTVIIGRTNEQEILGNLLNSKQSELLAVYGRRRVGKTYLIKTYYADKLAFACSGQLEGTTKDQLENFDEQLSLYFPDLKRTHIPQTWRQAFNQLKQGLDKIKTPGKKVLFFDEIPWLDTRKSGFLSTFEYFWNTYCFDRNDLIVVICGSAASWIIKKVVNNKGGLHNRITSRIRLLPFSLKETKEYLTYRNINLDNYQLIQLYMAIGGIPQYLNAVKRGKSTQQNIQSICFDNNGPLHNEFDNLYRALFINPDKHINIIHALSKKNKGLTRNELLVLTKLDSGGGITTVLNELTESGFIEKIYPFKKKQNDTLYRLSDEFSLFYLRFMQGGENNNWEAKITSASYITWCGYAFESIVLKHTQQIKQALGIRAIQTTHSSWHKAGTNNQKGAQIDLLIDRSDHTINICEIKFSNTPYKITKKYNEELQNKLMMFRQSTDTRKTLMMTFITTYGIYDNEYRIQLEDNVVKMDDLFN